MFPFKLAFVGSHFELLLLNIQQEFEDRESLSCIGITFALTAQSVPTTVDQIPRVSARVE